MIQHGILDLEAIYEMLGPEDVLIQENAEKEIVAAREFVRKMNIVSTKDKEESDDKPQEDPLEEEVKVCSKIIKNYAIFLNISRDLKDFKRRFPVHYLSKYYFPLVFNESKIWTVGSIVTSWCLGPCRKNYWRITNTLCSCPTNNS